MSTGLGDTIEGNDTADFVKADQPIAAPPSPLLYVTHCLRSTIICMDSNPAATYSTPRRRILRGKVTVEYSTRVLFPKLHVGSDCPGFETTPDEARSPLMFTSVSELALFRDGRPCRMCALEPMLRTLLTCGAGPAELVTFTSQPNPMSPESSVYSYRWGAVTQSGTRRLSRLVRDTKLETCQTPSCGPAAYGMVPAEAADALRWNLRTHTLPTQARIPQRESIETFWALINDAPPQLDAAAGAANVRELWLAAVALTS